MMMQSTPIKPPADEAREKWFDELLATLSTHRLMLETNTAGPELSNIYNQLIGGNADALAQQSLELAQRHFVPRMLLEYLQQLRTAGIQSQSLAFDLNDHEVLVWATIPEDDEAMEQALILAEARVNAKYHPFGFDLTSTIVEESDGMPIPNHYTVFPMAQAG